MNSSLQTFGTSSAARVGLDKAVPETFRIRDKNACCACMNAFLLSCSFLDGDPADFTDVYMGSLLDQGCPPYPFALKEFLKKSR